jgi:hypothetical protein
MLEIPLAGSSVKYSMQTISSGYVVVMLTKGA